MREVKWFYDFYIDQYFLKKALLWTYLIKINSLTIVLNEITFHGDFE